MDQIFISYSSEDIQVVESIVSHLIKKGYSVWWDKEINGGDQFNDTIEKVLTEAKCIIVVWSKKSVKSTWVKAEASIGLARGVLLPIIIEENVKVPLPFNSIHSLEIPLKGNDIDSIDLNIFYRSIDQLVNRKNDLLTKHKNLPDQTNKIYLSKRLIIFSFLMSALLFGGLFLLYYELYLIRVNERTKFALEITGEWNDKTSDIRIGLDMIRAENVSRGRHQYFALETQRAKELYYSTPEDSLDYILRGHIMSVLNHFEYIARAYETNAADQKILEESLYPVMTRTYCILEPFVDANNSIVSDVLGKNVSSWPPLERVIKLWRETHSINCDDVTSKWAQEESSSD